MEYIADAVITKPLLERSVFSVLWNSDVSVEKVFGIIHAFIINSLF